MWQKAKASTTRPWTAARQPPRRYDHEADWKTKTGRHMTSRQRRDIRSWDGEGWMHRAVSKAADADRGAEGESPNRNWNESWAHKGCGFTSLHSVIVAIRFSKSDFKGSFFLLIRHCFIKKTGRDANRSRSHLQIACFVWARAHNYYIKTEIHWFHLQIFGIFSLAMLAVWSSGWQSRSLRNVSTTAPWINTAFCTDIHVSQRMTLTIYL